MREADAHLDAGRPVADRFALGGREPGCGDQFVVQIEEVDAVEGPGRVGGECVAEARTPIAVEPPARGEEVVFFTSLAFSSRSLRIWSSSGVWSNVPSKNFE